MTFLHFADLVSPEKQAASFYRVNRMSIQPLFLGLYRVKSVQSYANIEFRRSFIFFYFPSSPPSFFFSFSPSHVFSEKPQHKVSLAYPDCFLSFWHRLSHSFLFCLSILSFLSLFISSLLIEFNNS